jgi:hypothetical protein
MPDDLFAWADGAALRDARIMTAAEAQERCAPGWAERAYQAIRTVAWCSPTVHVDDVLRVFPDRPLHPNAWGAIWSRAIRERVISRTGQIRETQDRRKHRHQYPVYRSLIYGAAQ